MSKPSKKTSTYPSARKAFVGHLLSRSTGHPAPTRAWIQVRRALPWRCLSGVRLLCACVYGCLLCALYVPRCVHLSCPPALAAPVHSVLGLTTVVCMTGMTGILASPPRLVARPASVGQGVIVWFCDTAIALDDGTGIATVSLTDKRWRQPDAEFTPSLGLYVGVVGALKASPVDSYLHMAGWRVLDLQYVTVPIRLVSSAAVSFCLSSAATRSQSQCPCPSP